jgi:hypothetical protein
VRKTSTGGFEKGWGQPAWADRPGGLLLAWISSSALMLTMLLCDRVLHEVAPPKCSSPLLCLYYWSLHLMVFSWVTSMLPCLTCLHDIPAKQSLGCSPCLSFACGLIKDVRGHLVMHHGACMVKLIKLPPSRHVLMLSTPLTLKK